MEAAAAMDWQCTLLLMLLRPLCLIAFSAPVISQLSIVWLQSLKAAHEDSMAAREAAAALDRQYKLLRRQYELDKARLETEVRGCCCCSSEIMCS